MFKNKTLWIIIAVVLVLFFWVRGVYNSMVTQDESVKTAWSQVENQYQRRLDLIPNLVNTVKGYASHERATLEGVINARANATKTTKPTPPITKVFRELICVCTRTTLLFICSSRKKIFMYTTPIGTKT
jgi:hypothetical protein